jgi:hypothetical protein
MNKMLGVILIVVGIIGLVACRGVTITMKGASFMYALRS